MVRTLDPCVGFTAKTLPHAARRAAAFQRMREVHRAEVAEDYVEMIADLIGVGASDGPRYTLSASTPTKATQIIR